MLRATQLQKRPAAFQRLTGVTPAEFDTILELANPVWHTANTKRLDNRKRSRAIGAGAKFHLELHALLLMTLIYLRQYCFLTLTAAPHGLGSHARIPRMATVQLR